MSMTRRKSPIELVKAEEARLGIRLPDWLRARLAEKVRTDVLLDGETWTLYPVWDPTSRSSARRTAGSIARETAELHRQFGDLLPAGALAVGEESDSGDILLIVAGEPHPLRLRMGSGTLEPVRVAGVRREASSSSRPDEPRASLEAALSGPHHAGGELVIEAPGTPYFVRFTFSQDATRAEAVGLANLPKLHVFRAGTTITQALAELKWSPPSDPSSGNWTRQWSAASWDVREVVRLVVDTFERAYHLYPRVLRVRT